MSSTIAMVERMGKRDGNYDENGIQNGVMVIGQVELRLMVDGGVLWKDTAPNFFSRV